jgi:hypothetical protein
MPQQTASQHHPAAMFSRIRLSQMKPVPFLCGLLAWISLTIAWILYVNHLVDTATIPGSDRHWIERARHEAYGVCYDGCNDCLDIGRIEEACRITSIVQIQGVTCDASRMWFWADRYPNECLEAVGGIYKEKDLKRKRFKLRFSYILATLTVLAGFAIYKATDRFIERRARQQRRARYRHRDGPRASATTPLLRATTVSTTLVTMLLCASLVDGYACRNWHPVHNQPLESEIDPTLFGNIHGWLSDCYTERYACGEKCDSDQRSSTTCTTEWCSRERADASPVDFVRRAAKLVTGCGFKMVDIVPGIVDKRIANPRIERDLWVKVSVNRFNGSGSGVVDAQVLCLSEVAKWPSFSPSSRDASVSSLFNIQTWFLKQQ